MTLAKPAINVNDSRAWSQNPNCPPKPRHFTMEKANSKPMASARRVTSLFMAKLGENCGDAWEMIQPLLVIGRKTPSSIRSCPGAAYRRTKLASRADMAPGSKRRLRHSAVRAAALGQ